MAAEIKPREQCPSCAANGRDTAKDNLAVYADGKFCQSCGYVEKTPAKKEEVYTSLIAGTVKGLTDRGLSQQTCEKYNIRTTLYTGQLNGVSVENEPVRIYPYYESGKVVKQKLKSALDKKKQSQRGVTKIKALFGQNLFNPSNKIPITITEGEEDAAAIWQMTGLPAVSIPNGAGNAAKDLAPHLEWLSGFREVLLAFDNDEPGRQAFNDCVGLFEPGLAKKVNFPLKDANDMLKANRIEEVKKCMWNAEVIKPDTLVFIEDILDQVLEEPKWGSPFPWPSMTKCTYGLRRGELYMIAGASSIGKTEVVRELISQHIDNDQRVGYFTFEQKPFQTAQRLIGASLNQRIHLPGCEAWKQLEIIREKAKILEGNKVAFYDVSSGPASMEKVLINIRFLAKAYGMHFFIVDNLKALSARPFIDGKRVAMHEYASICMGEFSAICKELGINIVVLNHLSENKIAKQAYISTSPKNSDEYLSRTAEDMEKYVNREGLTWESGRFPTLEDIFSGGATKDMCDWIIVLARNRISEDKEIHRTLHVRFLKTRLDSTYEGFTFKIKYNYDTGRLVEEYGQISTPTSQDVGQNMTCLE